MEILDENVIDLFYDYFKKCIKDENLVIGYELCDNQKTILSYLNPALSADKANWLRRKKNITKTFDASSLEVSEKNQFDLKQFSEKYGYNLADYTLTPGAVPIRNSRGYTVGILTVTGLTPQKDHDLAVTVIERVNDALETSI